jgi:hypothetical protein
LANRQWLLKLTSQSPNNTSKTGNTKTKIAAAVLVIIIVLAVAGIYYTSTTNPTTNPTQTPQPTPTPTDTTQPTTEPTTTTQPTTTPTQPTQTSQPTASPTETLTGTAAELYYASTLFRQLDQPTRDIVVQVADANGSSVPARKNLAIIALGHIEGDQTITDKQTTAKEAFKIYALFPTEYQTSPQIYCIYNAVAYFGSANTLTDEINQATLQPIIQNIARHKNIASGVPDQRQYVSILRLGAYTPAIMDWPGDWREAVGQIEEIVYKNNFDKVNGDRYVWENVVNHAVDFIMKQRADGKITAPDGEIDVLHAQLFQIDLLTGSIAQAGNPGSNLEMAVKNVGPNATHSPLRQVADIVEEHYTNREKNIDWCFEKWSAYDIANYSAYRRGDGCGINWPNCNVKYQENLDKIEDRIVFTIGEPFMLMNFCTIPDLYEMPEQLIPLYTNLLAYMSGIKSRVDTAIYPSGSQFYHDEPSFYIDGKWFSFYDNFGNYDAFKSDYGENQAPILMRSGTDGKDKNLNL